MFAAQRAASIPSPVSQEEGSGRQADHVMIERVVRAQRPL
jgi:hypothetical protein